MEKRKYYTDKEIEILFNRFLELKNARKCVTTEEMEAEYALVGDILFERYKEQLMGILNYN